MNEFMGIPIDGDIERGRTSGKVQRPQEELVPLFEAALADAHIVEFGWSQYTPFFNDGDVCEFNVYDLWVRTEWDDPDAAGDEELYVSGNHPSLSASHFTYTYVPGDGYDRYGRRITETITEEHVNPNYSAEREQVCAALSRAVQGGEFDDVLYELFGDHANITVRREGITVDYYDHD